VLVVLEEDEALRHDRRVTGEEEPDVDLLPVERGDGERAARVERLEVLELDAVGLFESRLAERSLSTRALRRSAEDELALRTPAADVGELLQVVLGRGVLGDDEAVLVRRRGGVQYGQLLRRERRL